MPTIGGQRYVDRHRTRGKMLVRERIEALVDPHTPFLELSPLAAWGTQDPVGAGVVTGIGIVEGTEVGDHRLGHHLPGRLGQPDDAGEVGPLLRDRPPESAAGHLAERVRGRRPAPAGRHLRAGGSPVQDTSPSCRGRASPPSPSASARRPRAARYVPGMSDYVVMVKDRATAYLGGPPLVKMAIDEDRRRGVARRRRDALAHQRAVGLPGRRRDGRAAHRSRHRARTCSGERRVPARAGPVTNHRHTRRRADRLRLGGRAHPLRRARGARPPARRQPLRGVQAALRRQAGLRLGSSCTASRSGSSANNGILFSEESKKGAQFIQLCNRTDTPLLFVQNITGFMVGSKAEQGGIIRNGAKLINAVSNSDVPHLVLMVGASYGAGNYGMSGRAYDPRFIFSWPNHRIAVMGPKQLSGVMDIVARNAAAGRGVPVDEEALAAQAVMLEGAIEEQSTALFATGRVWDDGIIHPNDSRTVLGMALSVTHSAPVIGSTEYGVWRH